MWRRQRHVTEKWLLSIRLDELHRPPHQHVHNEALRAKRLPVVLQRWVEILTPVTTCVAHILLKPTSIRMIRPLAAIVPFAEGPRGITACQKAVGDGLLIRVHPLLSRRDPQHPAARVVASCQKLRSCRCTERTHKKAVKTGPRLRQ